jgi:hypothetical protein
VQVLEHGARRADRRGEVRAAVAVQRLDLEMLRERVVRLVEQEEVALADLRALG